MLRWTGKKILKFTILFSLLSGCSEFAILSSGSSLAISHNSYAKAYNGIDFATAITTKKDIKTHAYHYVTKAREIKKLVQLILPSQVIITNIQSTHLENFKNKRKIAIEKSDIFNPKYNPEVELLILPN